MDSKFIVPAANSRPTLIGLKADLQVRVQAILMSSLIR